MSLFSLKKLRQEAKVSQGFPITHLNSPTIFETKNGFLGGTLILQGAPFITEAAEYLNELSYTLHQALTNLTEEFLCYVTTHRKKEDIHLDGEFASQFAAQVNQKYHARFKNKALYRNYFYLTIILKEDLSSTSSKILSWSKRLLNTRVLVDLEEMREKKINVITTLLSLLETSLAKFSPRLLGSLDESLGYSEMLEFLSLFLNGGDQLKFKPCAYAPPVANSIPESFSAEQSYPQGHLGQYIGSKQLFFGDYLQFKGTTTSHFGAILSVKKYPLETASIILDLLLAVDGEFISTHSFAPLPREVALKGTNLKRGKLTNSNDAAFSQINQLSELEDEIASGITLLGHHHNSLLVLASDIASLQELIREVTQVYSYAGFAVVKETLGMEVAFWAQIPGNHHFIARASLITSRNFVSFCSFHNTQSGFRDQNHLGSAITLVETTAKTPVFFNYHTTGTKTNPAKGHSLIFGGSNAGKTTFIAFMDAQMGRYHGKSFFIDRDEALKIYILASGSSNYLVMAPGKAPAMNPLQLEDNAENRAFLKQWLGLLVKRPEEDDLPAEITAIISDSINYNFENLAPDYRNLTNLSFYFPVDFSRWPELKRWLQGSPDREEGEHAWLFDNQKDELDLNFSKLGFDLGYLIDNLSSLVTTPVYYYILHVMQQSLTGDLTTFYFDEAFQVFNDSFWVKKFRDLIPTIRKKNGHFVFSTQSPQTVTNSQICPTILDNLATLILFPNPQADFTTYVHHLKISEAQYDLIKNNHPDSRLFLYKQEQEAILCKLDLSDLAEEMKVFSANSKSVHLVDELRQSLGPFPELWLAPFLAAKKEVAA